MKILVVFILFTTLCFSQNKPIPTHIIDSTSFNGENFVGSDAYGFQYKTKDNVLSKTDNLKTFEYKKIPFGPLTKIDIQNPLQMVLFYENFNAVVILDNQFNEIQSILFSENEFPIVVSAVGLASQNRLWLFNALNQQITMYNRVKNTFITLSQPIKKKIIYYQTDYNSFFWVDEDLQSYSCDVFGKITSLGTIPKFDTIQFISDKELLYQDEILLYYYSIPLKNTQKINLDKKTFKSFRYKAGILTIFTDTKIINYKINIE